MKFTDGWTDFELADRKIETTWITDVAYRGGVRQVTLTARHTRASGYRVLAAIVTRMEENGSVYTIGTVFEDPVVSLFQRHGRYSAKRLEEVFDAVSAQFDAGWFYQNYEKEGVAR